jgi:hypothetical protein
MFLRRLRKAVQMSITAEQAVRMVEITRRKADELFDELIVELRRDIRSMSSLATRKLVVETERRAAMQQNGPTEPWSLGNTTLSGDWEEVGREGGVTYRWPDGNVDTYADFVSYRGSGGYVGLNLALGYVKNGDVCGFVVGPGGGAKRGITYFIPADDFAQTREKVSLIRGGGPRGRSGFAPGEALPKGYDGFKVDVLRERKAGKWNVQAVVVRENDHATMLGHTALQAHLRGLV